MAETVTGIVKHRVVLDGENPILLSGEIGIDNESRDIRVGDGVTLWTSLSSIVSSSSSFDNRGGLIIPWYIYPGDVWTDTTINDFIDSTKYGRLVDYVIIINPSSGPGTVVDGNYTYLISKMQGIPATMIGYVSTSWTTRDISLVKADIDKYIELYPRIEGIFFDEMTYEDNQTYIDYYKELNTYVKNKGLSVTVTNPGAQFAGSYQDADVADIIIGWESDTLPTTAQMQENWVGGAAETSIMKRGILLHSQATFPTNGQEISTYFGWMYITADVMPNPWDTLSGYLIEMFQRIVFANIGS